MARPLRIEFPGAVYHVTSRGNARDTIFINDSDREDFLWILGSVIQRYNWLCHAYCLMDNHYHLLIETIEGNISQGMRQLNGVYTQKLNGKHARTGHIFQGRFKAILVEKESYLLEVSRYIVLNPVRAKMVERPEAWRWSNYNATAQITSAPEFLTVDWILGCFADNKKGATECYREFVSNADTGSSPLDKVKGQLFLGGEEFGKRLIGPLSGTMDIKEVPREQRYASRLSLKELLPPTTLTDKAAHEQRIYNAHAEYGYSLKEIGDHLGVHYATVSKMGERAQEEKWQSKT